jgi:hypothetical protein
VPVNVFRTLIVVMVAALTLPSTATTQPARGVRVEVYGDHTDVGGGAPYAHFIGAFSAPDILFGTRADFRWHPYSLANFGARVFGVLDVAADGEYAFTLDADDGGCLLFIDGALVADHGGGRGPEPVTGRVFLSAGRHPFEVQFFEDYGGPSGLDLVLPPGVSYGPIPKE